MPPVADKIIHPITVLTWKGRILLNAINSFKKSDLMYWIPARVPKIAPTIKANKASVIKIKGILFIIDFCISFQPIQKHCVQHLLLGNNQFYQLQLKTAQVHLFRLQ